jgi:hypothetical protein
MVLRYCGTTVLWYCGTTVLWYYGTVVPRYCGIALWYYGTVVLGYCSIGVLRYCGTMVLWYYGTNSTVELTIQPKKNRVTTIHRGLGPNYANIFGDCVSWNYNPKGALQKYSDGVVAWLVISRFIFNQYYNICH